MSVVAEIDHEAFRHNVSTLCDRVAPSSVMLAVKANAYGHGMLALAPTALEAGAQSLAVLEIPAALALREAGITCRLFAWLHGVESDFDAAIRSEVDLGVSSLDELRRIADAAAPGRPARVHLKIDTGLRRNGAMPEDWPALVNHARELEHVGLVRVVGIWSHLADASPEDDVTALLAFQKAVQVAESAPLSPEVRHLAASSAGWREPRARFDIVRFGIAAYGISPFDDLSASDMGLRAVMTLRTEVLDASSAAGHRWIGAGWAHGVPLGSREAEVAIGERRAPVVRVDPLRTLVRDNGRALPGDAVVIFGQPESGAPSAEDWARWSATIGDEVVTGVPDRVPREHRASTSPCVTRLPIS